MKRKPSKSAIDGFKKWEENLRREAQRDYFRESGFLELLISLAFITGALFCMDIFFHLLGIL